MNSKHKILFLIHLMAFSFLVPCPVLVSQTEYSKKFLVEFSKKGYAEKVKMFDTLKGKLKPEIYPFVKDELQKIKEEASKNHKTDILDQLYKSEGEIYYFKKNYSRAIPIFQDLLTKLKVKTAKDSALLMHYLKKAYVHIHSLNKAVEIHRLMEPLRKKHPEISQWMFHPKLSSIYYEMRLYKECLNQQLLEYEEIDNSDYYTYLGYFNNRGLFWNKAGNFDSAIYCYKQARNYFSLHYQNKPLKDEERSILGLIEGNIGQAYMQLGQYDEAIPLLKSDVNISLKTSNYLNAAVSETELAKCYLNLKKYKECKQYLDSANVHLVNVDDYNSKLELAKQYANYYNKIGMKQESIEYYNRYIALRDSFEKEQNIKDLIAAQIANQIQQKENVIKENQKKITEKNNEIRRERLIKNTVLAGILFLIIIIIFISYQLIRVNTQKKLLELKNKKIKTRNSIINKSLHEKDLLVKEVHHRVKNNLQIVSSLLKLQTLKTANKDIQTSLNEAQERINSMAILHQLLYKNNQMTRLSLKEYLNNLIGQITNSFSSSNKKITTNVRLIELDLDIDTAIPLGLITNEIMSNSFKHAFKGTEGIIDVELKKIVKDTYSLKISDNGIGIPANFDIDNIESLGLDIVSILSEQINAELKIYNQNGAHFEIIFKAQ